LHRLPAIVAAFWIWIDPTSRAAWRSASKAGGRLEAAMSAQRVAAPKT